MPKYIYIILLAFGVSSCLTPASEPTGVATEDIVFTSGEKMVITGRVLATTAVAISDHGFIVSKDENFSSPITLELGERLIPGRFVGEFDNLDISQEYFVKSYIQDQDGLKEGNVLVFSTLNPIVDDFFPRVSPPNSQITIQGRNFTKDAKVFFGDREVQIVSRSDESFITINTPPIAGSVFEEINIVIEGENFSPPFPFEYVIGVWEKGQQFTSDNNYVDAISFRLGDDVIFGMGARNGFGPYNAEIFSYNTVDEDWRSIPFFGFGAAHSFDCDGFFGSGSSQFVRPTDQSYTLLNDFYRFEDGVIVYEGGLPFRLLKAHAQRIDNKVYVFGGLTESIEFNDLVHIYDINEQEWSLGEPLPQDILTDSDFPSFVYSGNIYFIDKDEIMFRYDVVSGATSYVAEYPSTISKNGLAEVIGDKAYIGVFDDKRLLYEFDFSTFEFKEKTGFTGNVREEVVASWVEGEKLFLIKNNIDSEERMIIWSFAPDEF